MYDVIKNVILNENFDLSWIILNIKKNCTRGDITDDQEKELIVLAQKHANPRNSYAPFQQQIEKAFSQIDLLSKAIDKLDERVRAIESGSPQEPQEPEVKDEYPEYVQPTGAHDAYNEGDKITFEGEKYVCKMNGCVWNPKDYPAGWKKVVEQSTLEEPPIVENV